MSTASSGHAGHGEAAASRPASGAIRPLDRYDAVLHLLALCPLLAVSDTLAKAVAISMVVLLILPAAVMLSWGLRRWLGEAARLAAAAFLLAGLIACAELLLDAWLHELHLSLGLFLPLTTVNLVLLERVAGVLPTGAGAPVLSRHLPAAVPAAVDPGITPEITLGIALKIALRTAGGMALTLLLLGAARELVGRGSLLHDAHLLGAWASGLGIQVFRIDMGFLLAMLPPGAFLALGLLLALRNWLSPRLPMQAVEAAHGDLELHQAPNAAHENDADHQ